MIVVLMKVQPFIGSAGILDDVVVRKVNGIVIVIMMIGILILVIIFEFLLIYQIMIMS